MGGFGGGVFICTGGGSVDVWSPGELRGLRSELQCEQTAGGCTKQM